MINKKIKLVFFVCFLMGFFLAGYHTSYAVKCEDGDGLKADPEFLDFVIDPPQVNAEVIKKDITLWNLNDWYEITIKKISLTNNASGFSVDDSKCKNVLLSNCLTMMYSCKLTIGYKPSEVGVSFSDTVKVDYEDNGEPKQKIISVTGITITPRDAPVDNPSSGNTSVTGKITFANPLQSNDPVKILSGLLKTLQEIVAIIAIIMIIIGGIMYMFSGLNEKSVELAKKMIGGAIIGLAIIVVAPAFLKEMLLILDPADPTASGMLGDASTFTEIAERILTVLLSGAGIIGIIALVIGAQQYMMSFGDEEKAKKAKGTVTHAIIGILIAMASLLIVKQIAFLLG